MKQKHLQIKPCAYLILTTFLFLCFLFPLYCAAKEMRYPVPCYEGEELNKVRAWEKKWVGKKIDHTNVDEVKEFLPESFYRMHKYPEEWGPNSFTIAPYKQLKPPQGQIDWTLKGAGKPSVDDKEALHDFVAGTPFPDPETGVEVMYNYEARPVWDERQQWMDRMYIYDHRRESVRSFAADIHILQSAERTTISPTPELAGNARGMRMGVIASYTAPPELKGILFLDNQYKDRTKEWDGWMWIAPLRRIRRQDTTQRQDHRSGMDFCSDDQNGWFGRVARNKYKLLRREEVLMGRHDKIEDATFVKGSIMWQNLNRERINTYVVEAVSKDPNYLYSKTVFWYDPETWCISYCDKYDRKGNLWKINDYCQAVYTSNDGQQYFDVCTNLHVDIQRKHATVAGGGFKDLNGLYGLSHYTPLELNRMGR
jgi:hypothetical protein